MSENFNQYDKKYKKVEDLPEEQRENFKNSGEGFVKKEAVENNDEAFDMAIKIEKQRNEESSDNERKTLNLIKEKDPKFYEALTGSFELVKNKLNNFKNEDYENPEKFSLALHKAILEVLEEIKRAEFYDEKYDKYIIKEFFDKDYTAYFDLSEEVGFSLTYGLLSEYVKRNFANSSGDELADYIKNIMLKKLFQKDQYYNKEYNMNILESYSGADLEKIMKEIANNNLEQLKKTGSDLEIICNYARPYITDELNKDGSFEKYRYLMGNMYHVVGSAIGKSFGYTYSGILEKL